MYEEPKCTVENKNIIVCVKYDLKTFVTLFIFSTSHQNIFRYTNLKVIIPIIFCLQKELNIVENKI